MDMTQNSLELEVGKVARATLQPKPGLVREAVEV